MRSSTTLLVLASFSSWLGCGDAPPDAPHETDAAGSSSTTSSASGASSGSGGDTSAVSASSSSDASLDGTTTGAGTDDTTDDTSPRVPGYTPFFAMDCNDGRLGTAATGPDAMEESTRMEYSADEAVDGRGQSCRTWIAAGQNLFGGRYVTPEIPIGDGDDIWMRQGLFFPDGFCFGFGDTPGDGWGAIKWMRIELDNVGPEGAPGDRLTLQLGDFAALACNDDTEVWGATREYAGTANLQPPSRPPLGTGQWHMIQWHVHLATDDTAFIRFWLDDEYLGQVDDVTLGAPDREIAFILYGDYWNGSPYQDASWYTDEVIMTVETPDTTDAEGHPYIDPSARADDWR